MNDESAPFRFTMVEMLVVMGIIGILATILLPALMNARENARRVSCMNNLKQLGLAMINYANEFNNFPRVNTATVNHPDVIDYDSANALVTYGVPLARNGVFLWRCSSSPAFPLGNDSGDVRLYGQSGAVSWANYAIMCNWKGISEYDSKSPEGSSPTNVSKDKIGPIIGDSVNDWTGEANSGAVGRQINGSHSTPARDAMGMNQIFSDGHGKWYNIGEVGGVAWESSDRKKFYWPDK